MTTQLEKTPLGGIPLVQHGWEVKSYLGRIITKPITSQEAMIEYAIHFHLSADELQRQIESGTVILTELSSGRQYSRAVLVEVFGADRFPDGLPPYVVSYQPVASDTGGGIGEGVSEQPVADGGNLAAAETETTEGPQSGQQAAD